MPADQVQAVPQANAQGGVQPEAPEIAAEQPDRLSPQFAALARKEKALRIEAQKLKSERDAWKIEQDKNKFNTDDYIPKDRIKNEAINVLIENGFSLDQIAQMTLNYNDRQDPRYSSLQAKIQELEGKTNKFESKFTEQQQNDREQAINQIRNEAKILIDSDPTYETIKAAGRIESVVKHIQQTYDEDGILLSVEEAAKEVEDLLVEEAMKLASLSKIKQRLQPPQAEEEKPQIIQKSQPQAIKTLTHDLTTAPAKQQLTAKDRVKRAIMAAQGLDPDTGKPRVAG